MPPPVPSPPLFPVFASLKGRQVVVVGAGIVARRKVTALLEAGAQVRVVAPGPLDGVLAEWVQSGVLEHRDGRFAAADLDEAWLVVAATDDRAVNLAVSDAALARRIWANVVDDAELSSVQFPARVERGAVQVAISSGGGAPMLARHLRRQLETQLDESLGPLAELFAQARARIRRRLPDTAARRRFFEQVLAGPIPALLRQGQAVRARQAFARALSTATPPPRGRVTLVGAGPGDPGLLTLRALRVLNEADVILYDRLVSPQVLALARRDAEAIEVGKHVGGDHHATQTRIHALLLERARAGQRVVRLKGGDPFVFGRGGEELEVLQAAGIDFEVVPGITAAIACGAYAGVPLTHREHAQSVRLVTAHTQHADDDGIDWPALARDRQTLAFYMGVSGLARLRDKLIEHGRGSATPFAIIENGTRPEQRVVVGTLADLPELARLHDVDAPSLLIVGEVASLARRLHWFGQAPLGAPASDAKTAELDLAA